MTIFTLSNTKSNKRLTRELQGAATKFDKVYKVIDKLKTGKHNRSRMKQLIAKYAD